MEQFTHPFLNVETIKETQSIDEIQKKREMLLHRLSFFSCMGNQELINQIQLAFNTYTQAYNEKVAETLEAENADYLDKINVSNINTPYANR